MQDSTLHSLGYHIFRNAIDITDYMKDSVLQLVENQPPVKRSRTKRSSSKIFNNKRNSVGDGLRAETDVGNASLLGLSTKIIQWANGNFPHHSVENMVIITSEPGCKRQVAHCDYEPTAQLANCPEKYFPCGLLVAVERHTKIVGWPNTIRLSTMQRDYAEEIAREPFEAFVVHLDPGDVLVFRGDLIHAGAEYESHNCRIHAYLDTPCVSRKGNRTWYPPVEWIK